MAAHQLSSDIEEGEGAECYWGGGCVFVLGHRKVTWQDGVQAGLWELAGCSVEEM